MALDLFDVLCDLTDDLQRLCPEVRPAHARCMLEALVERLDGIIDAIVCFVPVEMDMGAEEETTDA